MTEYVAGFMFSDKKTLGGVGEEVALILKKRPHWQAGKLNGIGGHIEPGESPLSAIVREFEEETGFTTSPTQWWPFAVLSGEDWDVHFFSTQGPLGELRTTTDEIVTVVPWRHVDPTVVIPNLSWLLPMAKTVPFERAHTFHITEEY